MAAPANSIPTNVGWSNDLLTSPLIGQQPPARVHARRSWLHRPATLASPSSPGLNGGHAPAPVSPCTPLHTGMPEAKRPRKAQAFRDRDVTVPSLNSMLEAAQQTMLASESALVQEEEEDRSYTPEGSPPDTSVWGLGFHGDSTPDVEEPDVEDVAQVQSPGDSLPDTEESDAEDVAEVKSPGDSATDPEESDAEDDAEVESPDTPSKIPVEQDKSPTKSAQIIGGLLSSAAKVSRPGRGQMLVTQTTWRWCVPGHHLANCKHDKEIDEERESSAAEA